MSVHRWEYSVQRQTLPWANPAGKACHDANCLKVWRYIARYTCRGPCETGRTHERREYLCESHARKWARLFGALFPGPPAADPLPSGAVAVVEYQAANRYEWETLLTIGPDYSSGALDGYDVPNHIVGLRVRTVWDNEREGMDEPLRAACLCKARDTEPEEGA